MVTDDAEIFRLHNLESAVDGPVASVRPRWMKTAHFPNCMYIQYALRGVMERVTYLKLCFHVPHKAFFTFMLT